MRATINTISKHWAGCSEDQIRQNVRTLNYIRELAARTQADVKRWNISKLFSENDDGNLLADFNQINQRFFAKMSEQIESSDSDIEVQEVPDEIRQQLEKFITDMATRDKRLTVTTIEYKERDLATWRLRIERTIQELIPLNIKLEAFEAGLEVSDRVKGVQKDLEEILIEGFWGDLIVDQSGMIWLATQTDIVMSERNTRAGIDCTVNLGRLSIGIDLSRGQVKVTPYKANKRAPGTGYYHPHIGRSGDPCWGDAEEMSTRHLVAWQIKPLLKLMEALLITYCDRHPFTPLSNFTGARGFGRRGDELKGAHFLRDQREADERQHARQETERQEHEEAETPPAPVVGRDSTLIIGALEPIEPPRFSMFRPVTITRIGE